MPWAPTSSSRSTAVREISLARARAVSPAPWAAWIWRAADSMAAGVCSVSTIT